IGALGMFYYQQTASLARQASRYASVHGTQWAKETGSTAATPTDIYNNAIVPNAAALNLSRITYAVGYNTSDSPTRISNVNGTVTATANTVTVTVNYQWIPEALLGGIRLTSTSTTTMNN